MAATDTAQRSRRGAAPIAFGNLALRVASAAVLLGVVVAALWTGWVELAVLVTVASLIAAWEYARLTRAAGSDPPAWLLYPLTGWLALGFAVPAVPGGAVTPLSAALVAGLLLAVATRTAVTRWATAAGGALYIGYSLSFYVALYRWRAVDTSHFGLRLVGLAVLCVIVNDTCAYFAGSAFGRHRFFPAISPRKSVEGAVAGVLASVALAAAAGPALIGISAGVGAGLGLLVAVVAQGGDLAESSLKRQAGVKDSSNLIPGHGGLLDRVDSLVLVAPAVYAYLKLIAL